jgi:DNA-binding MarR family transcriptional regulator
MVRQGRRIGLVADKGADAQGALSRHALAARTGFVLIKLGEVVKAGAEQTLAEIDLTGRHFDLMASVAADESLSQRDIGRLLGIAPNIVGDVVDDLEGRDLIVRRRSRSDRRRHVLTLTGDGRALLRSAEALATAGQQELLGSLDEHEVAKLHDLATRVLASHWPPATEEP